MNFDIPGDPTACLTEYTKQFAEILRPKLWISLYISSDKIGEIYCNHVNNRHIQEALSEISLKFRDTLFSVSCDFGTSECNSPYKIYAKNGLTEIVYGEVVITYPETSFS